MHKNIIISLFIIIISVNFANAQSLFNNRYDFEKGTELIGGVIYDNDYMYITGSSRDSTRR